MTRKTILEIIHQSNSAHIGAAFSCVEILQAIYNSIDIDKIKTWSQDRDRVIMSKGHAAAALYTTLFQFGILSEEELKTYNLNGSLLSGHVSHFVRGVEHSTGALGHGLPVALGMALGLRSKRISARVFVILGDGELHEGANWEAIMMAGHLKMNNLCILIDNNSLSQVGRTDSCCSLAPIKEKFQSFNCKTYKVSGHDHDQISQVIANYHDNAPLAIICETVKGRGVSFMENNNLWHYRTPQGADFDKAMSELGDQEK